MYKRVTLLIAVLTVLGSGCGEFPTPKIETGQCLPAEGWEIIPVGETTNGCARWYERLLEQEDGTYPCPPGQVVVCKVERPGAGSTPHGIYVTYDGDVMVVQKKE